MRDSQKMAVIGGVAAAVVGATGFGVYALVGGEEPESGDRTRVTTSSGGGEKPGSARTGPPTSQEVRTAGGDFLTAWAAGDLRGAAELTDDEDTALKALTDFGKKAGIDKAELTPGTPKGATLPFGVAAQVTAKLETGEQRGAWDYDSALQVVREEKTGDAVVKWQPSVLHPKLEDDQSIVTGAAGTAPVKAVDRNGGELTAEDHPTLAATLTDLRKRYGDKTEDGRPGVETRIVDAEGEDTGTTLHTLTEGTPGTVRTTIDPAVQKAAEAAVANSAKAAVVAVKPSTGEILAIANSPAGGFDTALQGRYAPGSTWKVVTAAMLLDKGLASPGAPHPCPKYFTHGGWKFQNLDKFEIEGGTFTDGFKTSCNTAFISQAPKLADDDLTKEARDVFGIGLNWQVGTTTFDGSVPVQSDAQMAASLIGQGAVRTNPLIMASVSATVKSGVFKQPYLVSPEVDGRTLATAPRGMKPQVAADLRALMNATATGGTAAEAMAGASGDIGAKTGSAEVDNQKKPNAWFTGYRGDIAAAAVVPDSGHGGKFAGPVVRKVLDSYGG